MKIRVIEKESNYSGSFYIVEAPCPICGNKVEGRVAKSRIDGNLSERIARKWANQIEEGEAVLQCRNCRASR